MGAEWCKAYQFNDEENFAQYDGKNQKKEEEQPIYNYGTYGDCPPIFGAPKSVEEIRKRLETFDRGSECCHRLRNMYRADFKGYSLARVEFYEAIRLIYFITQGRKLKKSAVWRSYHEGITKTGYIGQMSSINLSIFSVCNLLKNFAKCCFILGRHEECMMACDRVIEIVNTFKMEVSDKSYAYYLMSFSMVDMKEFGRAQMFIDVVRNLDENSDDNLQEGGTRSTKMISCQKYLDSVVNQSEFEGFLPSMLKEKKDVMNSDEFREYQPKYNIYIPPLDPRNMGKYYKVDDLMVERYHYVSDVDVLEEMEEGVHGFSINCVGKKIFLWKVFIAL